MTFLFVLIIFLHFLYIPEGYAAFTEYVPPQIGFLKPSKLSQDGVLLHGMEIPLSTSHELKFLFHPDQNEVLPTEFMRYIKYFLTALAIPEDELWVNLSPVEKDRIIPQPLNLTDMGRTLLEQDYLLKQFVSSLTHPETPSGKEFWSRIRQEKLESWVKGKDGFLESISKVWIVPKEALVHEKGRYAFIVKSRLQVMFQDDYERVHQASREEAAGMWGEEWEQSKRATQIVQEVLLPYIEQEVNQGEYFVALRQIYAAMIMAEWYKQRVVSQSVWGKNFIGRAKIKGFDTEDLSIPDKVYGVYLKSVHQGVFDYIYEEFDRQTHELVPRKYFSGGFSAGLQGSRLSENLRIVDNAEGGAIDAQADISVSVRLEDIPGAGIPKTARVLKTRKQVNDFLAHSDRQQGYISAQNGEWIPFQVPPELPLHSPVREITFILDIDGTVTNSEYEAISPGCLQQIVRLVRMAGERKEFNVKFIFTTAFPFDLYEEAGGAPAVSTWDWEKIEQQTQGKEIFQELRSAVMADISRQRKTASEFHANYYTRESVKLRFFNPLVRKLKEEGLISLVGSIKLISSSGGKISYDPQKQEYIRIKNGVVEISPGEADHLMRELCVGFLQEAGFVLGMDFSSYQERVRSALLLWDERGVQGVMAEWQRQTGYHVRLMARAQSVVINYDMDLNGTMIAQRASQALKEKDFYFKGGVPDAQGGAHVAAISFSDKNEWIAQEVQNDQIMIAVGNSDDDNFLFDPDRRKMIPVFVGDERLVRAYPGVIVARDESGRDKMSYKGTENLLKGIADVMERGGDFYEVPFLGGRYSPAELVSSLPFDRPMIARTMGIDVDVELQDQIRQGRVSRVVRKGDEFIFKPEAPLGVEPDLIKIYMMTNKIKVMQEKYLQYLSRARSKAVLSRALEQHASAFKNYTDKEKRALLYIASEVDLYIVDSSGFLFEAGLLSHVRKGTYSRDQDLSYSGIWLSEQLMTTWTEDDIAGFFLLKARDIYEGKDQMDDPGGLFLQLEARLGAGGVSAPDMDRQKGQKKALDSTKEAFILTGLSTERQAYKETLEKLFSQASLTFAEKVKVVNALARISDEALALRKESWPALEVEHIQQCLEIDADGFVAFLVKEKEKYAQMKNESGEAFFSQEEIESLLFKRMLPYEWVKKFIKEGLSKDGILFLCRYSGYPLQQWERIKAYKKVFERDGIPAVWATILAFSGEKILNLWNTDLKAKGRELEQRGVDRLWAIYLVLTHPQDALDYWTKSIKPKKERLERQKKLTDAWALYYAVFEEDLLRRDRYSSAAPFALGTGFDLLVFNDLAPSFIADDNEAIGVELSSDKKTVVEDQVDYWRTALIKEGFEEPFLTDLLSTYNNPLEKALKIREMALDVYKIFPQLGWQGSLEVVFKLFHPRTVHPQQEARKTDNMIKHLYFGRGKRGVRNYYQGYIFPSKLERDTAIFLQYVGLIQDIEMGKNWQVPLDSLCLDYYFKYRGRYIIMEPHKEPQGQLFLIPRADVEFILSHNSDWLTKLFVNPKMKMLKFRSDYLKKVDLLPLTITQRHLLKNIWRMNMGRTIDSYASQRENSLRQSGYANFSLYAFESTQRLRDILEKNFDVFLTANDMEEISYRIKRADQESDYHIVNSLLLYWTGAPNLKQSIGGDGFGKDLAQESRIQSDGGVDLNPAYLDLQITGTVTEPNIVGDHDLVPADELEGLKPVIVQVFQPKGMVMPGK